MRMRPQRPFVGASAIAALLAACSGGQPWVSGEGGTPGSSGGEGGSPSTSSGSGGSSGGSSATDSGGGSGSSSGGPVGGSCKSCASDMDCVSHCGPTTQYMYYWCCGSGQCFEWSTPTCPGSSSGSGGGSGGSSGGSSGGGSGGGSGGSSGAGMGCGTMGQPCCPRTPGPRCTSGTCTQGMCQ
jgi:hypothetical protein